MHAGTSTLRQMEASRLRAVVAMSDFSQHKTEDIALGQGYSTFFEEF